MTASLVRRFVLWIPVFSAAALFGCGRDATRSPEATPDSAAGHSHADHHHEVEITADDVERPADYGAAVSRIRTYRDSLRDAVAADRIDEAHRALDEAEFVLQWLPEIARDSNIPRQHWQTINENAQRIRDLFNKVHDNIDEDRDPDYASVAEQVDLAIGALDAIPTTLEPDESELDD
jgi:hypothetical protein